MVWYVKTELELKGFNGKSELKLKGIGRALNKQMFYSWSRESAVLFALVIRIEIRWKLAEPS